ncbi:MAG: hypothetical protein LBS75_00135 [Synergistaceae bacterium]|jgi:hypothetical protein|nr:hypothetical protein [Synergistaceae bacterium]
MNLFKSGVLAFVLVSFAVSLSMEASPSCTGDRDAALRILDDWTSIRWGVDNLAWVVHYPEELVEPWINYEAEKLRLGPEQIDEYRKSFTDELRIGSATAIMLSIQALGPEPVNISPLAKNIVLIDSAGRRISPIVFEKRLDGPLIGLVQGFVFFPLQSDGNFKIGLSGLIPDSETQFTFRGSEAKSAIATTAVQPAAGRNQQWKAPQKEVVVRIPTKKPTPPKDPAPPEQEAPDYSTEGEVFQPTAPPQATPLPDAFDAEPPEVNPPALEETVPTEPTLPPLDERQVLPIYLKAWIDGDADKMYSLLSAESQRRISRELFAKEAMSGGFRSALRAGYKVSWADGSARVTVAKKVLFVRTLETKQIDFVQENGSARVSW